MLTFPLADLINWGWLRIGPPYIYLNIDPVIFNIGPVAVRWYGLMYVVGIIMGLWAIRRYTARKGIDQDMVYRILWWCIFVGVICERLYFVIQQPDLVQGYILQPQRILATWEGHGLLWRHLPGDRDAHLARTRRTRQSHGADRCGRVTGNNRSNLRTHQQYRQWRYYRLSQHPAL